MNGKSISVDGIETYYVEQGEGPTIVFMHGGSPGMDAWACWMRQFAGLARNYRVIAFDQIGYGRSGGPLLPGSSGPIMLLVFSRNSVSVTPAWSATRKVGS